ncbi:MAG TPA: hypothetical protein VER96_24945 [Polyangiaceae bacterium]|nr:hypothetical protein [Polyangiaceae bacterium]
MFLALSGCAKNDRTSSPGGGSSVTTGAGGAGGAGGATTSDSGGMAHGGWSSANGGALTAQGGASVAGNASGGSAGVSSVTGASVLERNGGPTREGHWVQPTLTKAAAAKMTLDADFSATFQGNMYASPLYIEHGPGGKGAFIAVSTDNVVAALDEATGATLWTKTLGSAPGSKGQACGASLDPVGILGTPVIDEKSGTIYVAAPIGTDSVERQEVHALSIEDGAPRAGWPVNVSAMKAGSLAFNTKFQNQRSALSLVNGIVYVGYGGFPGDCDDYHGWIIAIDAADPSKTGAWATAGQSEAIWASGGFASDGTSIFPVTGNGKASSRDESNSESILRISGLAQFQKSNENEFYPSTWKSMDSADVDLGSSNSILMRIPGASMPDRVLVAMGKDGKIFLVDPSHLGGSDGQLAALQVANPAMPALTGVKTSPTAFATANGTYLAFTVESAPDCPNNVIGRAVMGVKISGGSTPTATVAWCTPGPNPPSAPISTTTDGRSNAIVWFVNNGQLKGVDGDTGETVFDGGSGSCAGVQRWTSPIAVKGRIVVGANGKLCSWRSSM